MSPATSRRQFVQGVGAAIASGLTASIPAHALLPPDLLYPPIDLSYFDTPISGASGDIRLGYAAITWAGNDRQAMEDIAGLGFPGIQLRANAIQEFGSAAQLRDLLAQRRLLMVALSSGGVRIDPAAEAEDLAKHIANAKFVHDAGGFYLQVTDERPKGREITPADCKRLGRLLTQLGKRTADLGVTLGYHNHWGTLSERPEELDRILEAADPRYAKFELDVGHYFVGHGDSAKAIEKYGDRLLFLHIKDAEWLPDKTGDAKHSYRFVELGHGQVDIPAVFDALYKVNFRGWAVVELDSVPDPARTPKECAVVCKKYLEEKLGMKI
ncbi:MAG TPA: sugar phosphate isomerase/epimerase [Candidatus Angelobacter sp.]|nr:sugar phosphate isomerase/epimerase [Candidatus Angelobacter sp.]